jgi:hypothetical protein
VRTQVERFRRSRRQSSLSFYDHQTLSRRHPIKYKVCMIHRLIAVAAWTLLVFIAYATISPIQARPTLSTSPSFERLAAFAVLGALFCLAYPRHIVFVCLIMLGSAVLLEFAQLLTPDRHGRIQDAIIKMTGGALGIVAGRAMLYLRQSSRAAGSRTNGSAGRSA